MSDPTQGWKTLSSRTVYESPWMRLTEDQVLTPKGARSTYAVSRFPAPGCCILPLDGEGCTWLVGQYRYPIGQYTWELPAGSVGADTDPLRGAQRELAEETGLAAARWHPYLHLAPINAATNLRSHVFVAWDLTHGAQNTEEGEEITLRRLPFADVVELVLRGEVTSSTSIAAVLQAHTLALRDRMPPEVTEVLRAGR